MGIYISEINMPKGEGSKLVLQIFPNGEVYDEHGFRLGITNWAEAISVPPHGRLIDADALIRNDYGCFHDRDGYPLMSCWAVEDAPTIIPAEEAEADERRV